MRRFLVVFLLFLVPGLIIFIAKVQIPWERINLFWLMALIFHVPLLLFFIVAILVEIMDSIGEGAAGNSEKRAREVTFYENRKPQG